VVCPGFAESACDVLARFVELGRDVDEEVVPRDHAIQGVDEGAISAGFALEVKKGVFDRMGLDKGGKGVGDDLVVLILDDAIPEGDDLAVDDCDDISDRPYELLTAVAVMFRTSLVDRIRAFRERAEIGIPHVVLTDGTTEEVVLCHQFELLGNGGLESLEFHDDAGPIKGYR